jgi:hypothetical protein
MNYASDSGKKKQAVFTLSIDFELMWGTTDRPYAQSFHQLCEEERREVIGRLLGLLEAYDIRATWGIVGHLFLDAADDRRVFAAKEPADLYYAPDLVRQVQSCKVAQDIGSHTFSHIEMAKEKCSKTAAEADVAACVREAGKWGIDMKSFIFPRNLVGHRDVLRRNGFTCYRGPEPHWYRNQRRIVRRVGHVMEIAMARTPPTVTPVEEDGIWNIPGSMLYTPSFGSRKHVPVWLRVLRAKRGLEAAVRKQEIFHLWFHPTDLVCRRDAMMDGLRRIFEHVARLRESGQLVVRAMRDLVPAPAGYEAAVREEVGVGREC